MECRPGSAGRIARSGCAWYPGGVRAAICLALALFAPACRPARSHPAGVDGKALYEKTCAQCHGVTGRGDTEAGRTLGAKDISRPEVKSLRDPELSHQIIVGRRHFDDADLFEKRFRFELQ